MQPQGRPCRPPPVQLRGPGCSTQQREERRGAGEGAGRASDRAAAGRRAASASRPARRLRLAHSPAAVLPALLPLPFRLLLPLLCLP